ncbi:hypothetical protein [Streptomyces sp. NPDC048419]|uniref:hypothetical protein n=1 Tax=Streptomyces sp. NPDC048419 TaxID=3365547 RepID=UPI003723239A
MNGRRIRGVTRASTAGVTAAVVGAVVLAGCGSSGTPGRSGSAPVASSSGAGSRTVNLVAYSHDDGPTSSVILTGAIGDYGSAESVTPGGAVDSDHRGDLQVRLTRGSFRIHVADIDKQLVTAFASFPPNRTTCSGNVVAAGPAPVVRGSGTGSYRGLTGTFRLTMTIAEVDARTHCTPSSAFLKQAVVTAGSGSVSLG